jgi:hypothetical protein
MDGRGPRAKSGRLGGPFLGEELRLFEDGLGGFFLFVGRVAVLAEDALDHGAELGLHAFLCGPVDGRVLVDGVDEFAKCWLSASMLGSAPKCCCL